MVHGIRRYVQVQAVWQAHGSRSSTRLQRHRDMLWSRLNRMVRMRERREYCAAAACCASGVVEVMATEEESGPSVPAGDCGCEAGALPSTIQRLRRCHAIPFTSLSVEQSAAASGERPREAAYIVKRYGK